MTMMVLIKKEKLGQRDRHEWKEDDVKAQGARHSQAKECLRPPAVGRLGQMLLTALLIP